MRKTHLLILIILIWPAHALAQDEGEIVSTLRQLNDRAEAYFRGGDYEASLRVMDRAQALRNQPRRTYNMAVCHERLGHLWRAIALLQQFISDPRSGRSWRIRARARLGALRDKLAIHEGRAEASTESSVESAP